MRISDWSSDVCSSDLTRSEDHWHKDRQERRWPCCSYCNRSQQFRHARLSVARTPHHRSARRIGTGAHPANADRARYTARCRLRPARSEEHTSELQSLMRTSYAVFCLKKKKSTLYIKDAITACPIKQ